MPITPLPALDRTSPTFKSEVDQFFGTKLPAFSVETEAARVEINESTETAEQAATIATQKAEAAALDAEATAADRVQTGQDKAATANDRIATGEDRAQITLEKQATAADRVQTGLDRQAVNEALDSIAGGPVYSVNGMTGNVTLPAPEIKRIERGSNTQITAANQGNLVDIVDGTFTQTFAPAATLGNGWYCYIRNSGDGDITLDPYGSEAIDGLSSYVMYPGEVRLLTCDGAAFHSIVLNAFFKVFTSSGTFQKPPGYRSFSGLMWSGGCSGRKSSSGQSAAGGAGGGCFPFNFVESDLSTSENITVGAGGAAVTTANTNGNIGGATSFGSKVTMTVASSYLTGSSISGAISLGLFVGFEGGAATSMPGKTNYGGAAPSETGSNRSGDSVFGGAGGASVSSAASTLGPGISALGGNGGIANWSVGGSDGDAPGGGGGGTQIGPRSGAGARGELRIWGIV